MINPVENEMIHVKHLYYMKNYKLYKISCRNEDDDYDNNDHDDYKLPKFSEVTFSISGTLAFHASKRT